MKGRLALSIWRWAKVRHAMVVVFESPVVLLMGRELEAACPLELVMCRVLLEPLAEQCACQVVLLPATAIGAWAEMLNFVLASLLLLEVAALVCRADEQCVCGVP